LRKAEPSTEKLLIQSLAEQLKMSRVIAVRPENLPDMLPFERRSELIGLEEIIPQMSRGRAELIPLLPVAPTAQACGVVRSEH
jgi:hypothetical protein